MVLKEKSSTAPTVVLPDDAPHLLVVDDDKHAVRILSDFLEARSMDAVPAFDGHERSPGSTTTAPSTSSSST